MCPSPLLCATLLALAAAAVNCQTTEQTPSQEKSLEQYVNKCVEESSGPVDVKPADYICACLGEETCSCRFSAELIEDKMAAAWEFPTRLSACVGGRGQGAGSRHKRSPSWRSSNNRCRRVFECSYRYGEYRCDLRWSCSF